MDDWNITWKEYFTDLAAMKGKKVGSSMPFGLAYFIASIAEFIFPLFGKNPPIAKKSAKATGTNRTVSTQKAKNELDWNSTITYKESMKRIKDSLQ
jgi:nucleoside-diphosphate-sugar epimerase